jgi:hypothetical protein
VLLINRPRRRTWLITFNSMEVMKKYCLKDNKKFWLNNIVDICFNALKRINLIVVPVNSRDTFAGEIIAYPSSIPHPHPSSPVMYVSNATRMHTLAFHR